MARANKVLENDRAEVFTYDTTKDAESVFSLNMGCRGIVRIMLEPIGGESSLLRTFNDVRDDRRPRTLATVIASDPGFEHLIGSRAIYDGERFELDADSPLQDSEELLNETSAFHRSEKNYGFSRIEYQDASLEIAFETLNPPASLLVFGAGADAIPLAKIASELGWQITVFDHRPAFLTADRFREANRLVLHNDEIPIALPAGDSRTVAVVMTHNYQKDAVILPLLLKSNVACIAALGPKRRTEQLLDESDESFTSEQLARLYAPAGLDIGAATPEAIALSIVAEIQSVLGSRSGGHLRERVGSIYDRK
jgi:xanthine/CO dehydrogenase XdhC/CoxF family maturation factor